MIKGEIEHLEELYEITDELIKNKNYDVGDNHIDIQYEIEQNNLYIFKQFNKILGFLIISKDSYDRKLFNEKSSFIKINNIIIKNENRYEGYELKILNFVLDYSYKRCIKSIRSEVIDKDISANKFYLENKFLYVGTITIDNKLYNCYERSLTNE